VTLIDVVLAFALVLANALFVASEFALARLRPTQVAELEREHRAGARSLRHALSHLDAYLAACQLGITIASIGLGVVGESAFEGLLAPLLGHEARIAGIGLAAALAFALITLLHVVIGELAPKSVAISRTTATALRIAAPMRLFYLATKPLVEVLGGLGNLVLRPFGIPPAREVGHAPHSEAELLDLLADSGEHGLIDVEEQHFAERGFAFADRLVGDVMRPRDEIDYVTLDAGLLHAAHQAVASGHTRLPACEPGDGPDRTVGLIHAQDLLAAVLHDPSVPLDRLVRPLARVPDDLAVTALLEAMRDEGRHMALVVDARGTTVGLVTLEDLLEELVGEIDDDRDRLVMTGNRGAGAR
jgi:CBS domain containing-hemolysin-like protein